MNLISLLITSCISSVLIICNLQWFQTTKKLSVAELQAIKEFETIHKTQQFFKQDIQSSGYRGCRSTDLSFPLNRVFYEQNPDYQFLRFDIPVFGFVASSGACRGKLPDITCQRIKENSEVLILYNVAQKFSGLKKAMSAPDEAITVSQKPQIWKNALTLISDCTQGDLFIASQVTGNQIFHDRIVEKNKSDALSKAYGTDAIVGEIQTVAYYLSARHTISTSSSDKNSTSPNQDSENKSLYGLYRDDLLHHADEISRDISEIKFEFAVFPGENKPLEYKKSSELQAQDWPHVQAVRITLTSSNNKVWIHEIAIRNRYGFNHCAFPFDGDLPFVFAGSQHFHADFQAVSSLTNTILQRRNGREQA